MSFISRSDDVFRRVIDRFNLKILTREPVTIRSELFPVFDISQLLEDPELFRKSEVTASSAFAQTVPDNEAWEIIAVGINRPTAGAWQVKVTNPDGDIMIIHYEASISTMGWVLPSPILVSAKWIVSSLSATATSETVVTTILVRRRKSAL